MDGIARLMSRVSGKPYRRSEVRYEEPPFLNDQGQVAFAPGDVENPRNWSTGRRTYVSIAAIMLLTNATFASSSPSGAFRVRARRTTRGLALAYAE